MNNASTLYRPPARKSFVGLTDRYSPYNNAAANGALQKALAQEAPYDLTGGLGGTSFSEKGAARFSDYRRYFQFYRGEHFVNMYEDGEKKVVFNFCKKVVNKGVDWLVAKGWSVRCGKGNEQVAAALNAVWDSNNRLGLTRQAALWAGITGDAFFLVSVEEDKVRLRALEPANVFPFWNDSGSELKAALLQYPIWDDKEKRLALYSLLITANKWTVYHDEKQISESVNPLGKVNVVHIPNLVSAESRFGESDLADIIPLNIEYNTVATSVRKVIKYHSEPTTLIFGARASDMERGAKKVWSGLPVEGRVENLELKGELALSTGYLKDLKTLICQTSNIPEVAMDGKIEHISNTSGLAMQMTYQPLIEKTSDKRERWGRGIRQINELIIRAHQTVLNSDWATLADNPKDLYSSGAAFTSALPKDEQTELDLALKRRASKIWSQAEAVRQVSGVEDIERLSLELAADDRAELATAYEKQKAALGISPNLSCVFLGSLPLTEDLLPVAEASQGIEQGSQESPAPAPEAKK